ncbi:MAG: hypothetical protein OHK0050_36480 [Roseiflexaceae bacterium]
MIARFQQKLTIPRPARQTLQRSELIAQIDNAVRTKQVTVLAAPAGWGKTTTLVQWVSQTSIPVVWYTIDPSDTNLRQFLFYLLHALSAVDTRAKELLGQLDTTAPRELAPLCELTAALVAEIEQPFALIFDDFHILADHADPLIFSLLASIGEYSNQCHLIYASRTVPTLHGLARLIAQQRAAVFDYAVLQLSPSEVQQLAGMSAGVLLSDQHANQLTSQLSGWVTGIVLLLDQVQAQPTLTQPALLQPTRLDELQVIGTNTTQVYAFLAEQVIAPLPEVLRTFLEETSVLDYLSPERCDTLRETSGSALLLDEIGQRGLFVTSQGNQQNYQLSYHALFRDFLQNRLTRHPQRRRYLLQRAGDIYASEDDLERAIDAYLMADTFDAALTLMRSVSARFRRLSRQSLLIGCFDRLAAYAEARSRLLPADLLIEQARSAIDLALWERARLSLTIAGATGSPAQQIDAQLMESSIHAMVGEFQQAVELLDLIDPQELDGGLRLLYLMTLGRAFVGIGQVQDAIKTLEQAQSLAASAQSIEELMLLGGVYDLLGYALAVNQRRDAALRILQRADACWQSVGNQGRRTMTLNNIGVLAMQAGRFQVARPALSNGLQIARHSGRRREAMILLTSLGDLDLFEGQLNSAEQSYHEAYGLAQQLDLNSTITLVAVSLALIGALRGQAAMVQEWLDLVNQRSLNLPADQQFRRSLAQGVVLATQAPLDAKGLRALLDRSGYEPELAAELSRFELALFFLLEALAATESIARQAWRSFSEYANQLPSTALLTIMTPLAQALQSCDPGWLHGAAAQIRASFAPVPPSWVVRTLGTVTLSAGDQAIDLSELHRAMLVRILDSGAAGVPAEQLWRDVWNDEYPSTPAIHQAMYRLRNISNLAVVIRNGRCVIKTPLESIQYDVGQLNELLRSPHPTIDALIRHYPGPFMPESDLPWFRQRRQEIRQQVIEAIEQQAQQLEETQPRQAIRGYQFILQIDPTREPVAVRVMNLAIRFGDQALLRETFDRLSHALQAIGTNPLASTLTLFQQRRTMTV